jgi:hypothetical protein
MLAVMGGAPELVARTFTSSQSVTIPFGVSRLESASGKGADGAPASTGEPTPGRIGWKVIYDRTYQRRDGGIDKTSSEGPPQFGTPKPGNYCDPTVETPDSTVYSSYTQCYIYVTYQEPDTPGQEYPATTGAASTGFGLTFPGGAGGPASVTNHGATAVTAGQSYALTIPAGGSITISYYL